MCRDLDIEKRYYVICVWVGGMCQHYLFNEIIHLHRKGLFHSQLTYKSILQKYIKRQPSALQFDVGMRRGLIMIILVIRLKPQKTHSFHKPSIILLKYENMINILKTFLYLTRDLILLPHHHNSLLPPVPGVFGKPTVQDMAVGVYSSLSRSELTSCMLYRYRSEYTRRRKKCPHSICAEEGRLGGSSCASRKKKNEWRGKI